MRLKLFEFRPDSQYRLSSHASHRAAWSSERSMPPTINAANASVQWPFVVESVRRVVVARCSGAVLGTQSLIVFCQPERVARPHKVSRVLRVRLQKVQHSHLCARARHGAARSVDAARPERTARLARPRRERRRDRRRLRAHKPEDALEQVRAQCCSAALRTEVRVQRHRQRERALVQRERGRRVLVQAQQLSAPVFHRVGFARTAAHAHHAVPDLVCALIHAPGRVCVHERPHNRVHSEESL